MRVLFDLWCEAIYLRFMAESGSDSLMRKCVADRFGDRVGGVAERPLGGLTFWVLRVAFGWLFLGIWCFGFG